MKKILILILIVILGIFGYNKYEDYQRYHPKNTDYKIPSDLDIDYHDKDMVYDYYQAVEDLNGFVTLQWNANRIDVLHPEDDNNKTSIILKEYTDKLAKVKYYEAKLQSSKAHKYKGFNNADIAMMEDSNMSVDDYLSQKEKEAFKIKMVSNFPQAPIRRGQKSAYIYEIQKVLNSKGYEMPLDGVFQTVTFNAIKDFEAKNNLYPDGVLDKMTLDALMK